MAITYFDEEKAATLVARLEALTSSGALKWVPLESDYRFGTTVGEYGFSISSKDSDDLAPHILGVFAKDENQKGRELQTIDSSEVEPEPAFAMEHLYEQVKRITLKADQVAEDILNALARIDPDEPPF